MSESVDPAHIRIAEALLFAAAEPLDENTLAQRLPEDANVQAVLAALAAQYEGRGVGLQKLAGRWAFVTAPDLAPLLSRYKEVPRKLSRAAIETLAIIAYHQPVTRAEIEEVRGVAISKGTLDLLLDTGWIRMRGRRRVPGRPVTYGTTDEFLIHFGLESLQDLPGIDELKAAGLLDPSMRRDALTGPMPGESPAGSESEESLEEAEIAAERAEAEAHAAAEAEAEAQAEAEAETQEQQAAAEAEQAEQDEAEPGQAEPEAEQAEAQPDEAEAQAGEAESEAEEEETSPEPAA